MCTSCYTLNKDQLIIATKYLADCGVLDDSFRRGLLLFAVINDFAAPSNEELRKGVPIIEAMNVLQGLVLI